MKICKDETWIGGLGEGRGGTGGGGGGVIMDSLICPPDAAICHSAQAALYIVNPRRCSLCCWFNTRPHGGR